MIDFCTTLQTTETCVAIQNTVAWIVLVAVLAVVLGGVWAFTDTLITYGRSRLDRRPPPAAPGLASDRRRLDAAISLTDWRRR